MGTRGSIGYIYKDKEYLAYNHFDSYPEGLGSDILELITELNQENGWNEFKENADKFQNIEEDKITDQNLIEKYKHYANLSVSNQNYSDPYCLFREIQGSTWIYEIYKGNLTHYTLDNNFIKDSLFCEYAYIINLDTNKLEFYNGFQKKPQKYNRFGENCNEEGYFPCRLIAIFNLHNINKDNISEIIEKMERICKLEIDDTSIVNYIRKSKLEEIEGKN
jgi:hypothetical protein